MEPAGSSSVDPPSDPPPPSRGLTRASAAAATDAGPPPFSCSRQRGRVGSALGQEGAGSGSGRAITL